MATTRADKPVSGSQTGPRSARAEQLVPTVTRHAVAITGATGYMGRALTTKLLARSHTVRALIRPGSRGRVVSGSDARELDVFDVDQLARAMEGQDCVVHLLGIAHPSPAKAREFVSVDLASARVSIEAATRVGIKHFIYVSVAQPAPVMKAYMSTRAEAERVLIESGLTATVLRPWYVLGPGHRWPMILLPLYACAELVPSWRASARRLGLVTLGQMTEALVRAIEQPPAAGTRRTVEVPEIRRGLG